MITIIRSDEVAEARDYLAEIFVDGFYVWLKYFSKDKDKLINAFKHAFILNYFYIAFIDNEYAGMIAVSDGQTDILKLDKKELSKKLGFIIGRIAYHVLKKEFGDNKNTAKPVMPEISFVSVLERHQRKGIAEKMINDVIKITPYSSYVLEVADSNDKAIKLYEKTGFTHYSKYPVKNSKQAGFDYYLYMVYNK